MRAETQKEGEVGILRSLPMRTYVAVLGLRSSLDELRDREEGQALVEYALILSLISVVAITALTLVGTNVTAILNSIAAAL